MKGTLRSYPRLRDARIEFQNPRRWQNADAPRCPKCGRPDCGVLDAVIVGWREWVRAFVECERGTSR